MTKNWMIFWIVWGIALLAGLVSVLGTVPVNMIFSNKFVAINTFQRLTGLSLFVLITTQIVLGAFMTKWTDILGAKIFRFHITEGIVSYTFMLIHPTLAAFAGINVIPTLRREDLIYDLGKLAFIVFTIAVFAALFRTKPFLAKHWRKFHVLNYFTFYLIAFHSYFAGTDIRNMPFTVVYWLGVTIVSVVVLVKLRHLLVERLLPHTK